MKAGTDDKKKLITAGVAGFFAIFALYFLYSELFGGTTPAPNPPTPAVVVTSSTVDSPSGAPVVSAPPGYAVGQGTARKLGTTSGQLDPTLHSEAMLRTESLLYSGTGRNIFASAAAAAPVAVKPIAPARPSIPGPLTPVRVNTGPPPPPPINLKFFGTSTSASGVRKAFLLQGDDVFLASPGDVVQRRYRILSIAPGSIMVEDIPNNNKQNLPLIPN